MKELSRSRPLGPYSGPPAKRPKSETPLLVWLRNAGVPVLTFARSVGADPKTAYYWMYGQVVPDLVYAFKIEAATEGGVAAESWLGTELAQLQWKQRTADAEKWKDQNRKNVRAYRQRAKDRQHPEEKVSHG